MPFIALLGLWGAVELATLIFAVIKIGFFPTIALLVLSSAAGSYLLRSQQQAVLRRWCWSGCGSRGRCGRRLWWFLRLAAVVRGASRRRGQRCR